MCYELGNGTKDLSFSNRILYIVASSTMKTLCICAIFLLGKWRITHYHKRMATLYRVSDNYNTFINGFMWYMFFFVPFCKKTKVYIENINRDFEMIRLFNCVFFCKGFALQFDILVGVGVYKPVPIRVSRLFSTARTYIDARL